MQTGTDHESDTILASGSDQLAAPRSHPPKKLQPTEHPVVAPAPGGVSTLEEDRRRPADAARTEVNSQQNLPADPENRVTGEPVKLPAQPKLLQPANLTERKTFVGDSPE